MGPFLSSLIYDPHCVWYYDYEPVFFNSQAFIFSTVNGWNPWVMFVGDDFSVMSSEFDCLFQVQTIHCDGDFCLRIWNVTNSSFQDYGHSDVHTQSAR